MKTKESVLRDVVRALRMVYDPEIPVNIYDLGLISKEEYQRRLKKLKEEK